MTLLPNRNRAVLDIRKLDEYCLDPAHPRGRHKAKVFAAALSIQKRDAGWLRDVLLEAVRNSEALELGADSYGTRWKVDVPLSRQGRQAMIRSIWMTEAGIDVPRFVTCWVL